MLANAPKNNGLSASEAGALYYFPEIPCSAGKEPETATDNGHFVGGSLDRNADQPHTNENRRDSTQVAGLIEEAFNKGMDQGRAETIAAQQKRVDKAAEALKTAVDALIRVRQQDMDRMETETVRLALAIAKKVVAHDTEHGRTIAHVVKAAMKKVTDPRQLTLKLNPQDVDAVQALGHESLMADDFASTLHMEADEAVLRGGCIIETQLGDVDARIDQQIKIVEELLTDQLPKSPIQG